MLEGKRYLEIICTVVEAVMSVLPVLLTVGVASCLAVVVLDLAFSFPKDPFFFLQS
jgi:hypothetical protein